MGQRAAKGRRPRWSERRQKGGGTQGWSRALSLAPNHNKTALNGASQLAESAQVAVIVADT